MKNYLFFSLVCAFVACKTPVKTVTLPQSRAAALSQMEVLKAFMTGSFDSGNQAAKDSAFYNISLHMYPVWPNKKGNWLYVEQAVTANQAKPYRQRFYQLEQVTTDEFISRVYTIDQPEKFIGKWQRPSFFNYHDESILTEKIGCEVYLTRQPDGRFTGGTQGKNCSSKLRGATYATSKVEITVSGIESWDQGFNEKDEQVWGAEKGGYYFKKQRPGN